jgi:glutamate-1-semialdehyde 2,1-aminomutase
MTRTAYDHMDHLAQRLLDGLTQAITAHHLPWHALRVGARVEFICAPGPLHSGAEAALAHQPQIEAALHMALLNRGCLIAPFHNMMLISPATKRRQVDTLIATFAEVLAELTA